MNKWKKYEDTMIPSKNYLREDFLPQGISMDTTTVSRETVCQVRDQETLLFIRSGNGKLVVNGSSYCVGRGSCILLHFFHFHKLIPDQGSTLEVFRCLIPSTTYQYMLMIPGADFQQLERTMNPIVCTIPEPEQETFVSLLHNMENCQNDWLRNLLFFELFGRRNRLFIQGLDG